VGDAAGTQFAPISAARLEVGLNMAAKLLILAASTLAIIPAASSAFWPRHDGGEVIRTVELNGPFLEFAQTHDRIQMRLVPARNEQEKRARASILVRDAEGDELAIPLKRGQTWASAELPAELASAGQLQISLQQ
jgi:hypothetical protein